MQHVESSVKIYFTKEYSRFRMKVGNRQLNQNKIRRITNDILGGLDVLRYFPILVEQNGDVLDIEDGQHRFWVAKKLKSHVWYILAESISLQEIATIASNTEKWKSDDYINCYVAQDNVHYKTLQEFMDKYNLPLSTSVNLLTTGKCGRNSGLSDRGDTGTIVFKRGLFKVKFFKEAVVFAEVCQQFKEFPGWRSKPFVTAVDTIINGGKCDMAELIEKFNANPKTIEKRGSPKEYLSQLEELYNFRMRSRRTIF